MSLHQSRPIVSPTEQACHQYSKYRTLYIVRMEICWNLLYTLSRFPPEQLYLPLRYLEEASRTRASLNLYHLLFISDTTYVLEEREQKDILAYPCIRINDII